MAPASDSRPLDGKAFAKTLGNTPGVYRMLDSRGHVLYVGKARDLKNRVASYFARSGVSKKTSALVAITCGIEITVTRTENEALILENNLIKEYQPRFNVLLRDDKSYPYIYISTEETYPALTFYRGARKKKGRYFGPYPGVTAVRETLNLLQKLFRIRSCEDTFFRNRSRPCLQYQIKRCTAPCVQLIDTQAYQESVRHTVMVLEGKNREVLDELVRCMESASKTQHYEAAAMYRDQIAALRRVQEKQYVSGDKKDHDVIVSVAKGGVGSVQVFYIRKGRILGNKTFIPQHTENATANEILAAFMPQYYLSREVPADILVNHPLLDRALLEEVLGERAGHRVAIAHHVRGERARWLQMAVTNAELALERHLASRLGVQQRSEALADALHLDGQPERIECFDISHTRGESAVGACVVFDTDGPVKTEYRRFNIEGITPGDDYEALRQALGRRYRRATRENGKFPDVVIIDGGKGQVKAARGVLEELQLSGITIVGVAKGPQRRAGSESLFLCDRKTPIILRSDSAALHLVQQIRDEAHRFAIGGHRQQRAKARRTSPLEQIDGIGPKRRRHLLKQFGGLQGIVRAGIEDLASVKGINKALAQRIYNAFHPDRTGPT
ncbi:MAG: excinuclease ABC subunit C [Gammaproteobacteria bacterium]|nr:MAG: excinuclease ABC subunit C [Gammaproteobacteria bacterium]TND06886.1 MAG: excinuclease ABC subunit C [Gammaproteobacteria bacterium]